MFAMAPPFNISDWYMAIAIPAIPIPAPLDVGVGLSNESILSARDRLSEV
jgi:hypothetical protein